MKIYNLDTGQIEEINNVHEQTKANELIKKGRAIELSLPEYDEFKQKADELHSKFESDAKAIKESDNPIMTDEVKRYELHKLEQEYREKSAEVEAKYTEWRKQAIADARQKAVQSYTKVSDNDKAFAEQYAARVNLRLLSEGDDVFTTIKSELELLTDGQKIALQSHLGAILASADVDVTVKQTIIDEITNVKDDASLALKIAEKMPNSVLEKMRISDAARNAVTNRTSII